MTDERATFETARTRLEEILVQVRKKDTSLEQSLDLLEEGVRLANTCNELIDQTSWRRAEGVGEGEEGADAAPQEDPVSEEDSSESSPVEEASVEELPDDERS